MLGNFRLLFAALLVLMLTACGGGGSTTGATGGSTTGATGGSTTGGSTTGTTGTSTQNPASANKIALSWNPPVTRADGSYLQANELAGYRVYMGTSSSNLSPLVDLNDEAITNYTISNLAAGSYYIAISAYDIDGQESRKSQIVKFVLS